MAVSDSFQERVKRLDAKHQQSASAPRSARTSTPNRRGGGIELMSPKTLMLAFGGLVSLVVVGSVLMVLLTVAH